MATTMLPRTSSSDDEKKQVALEVERRASVASVRSMAESLHDLPDPDAGKSDEERAAIVRTPVHNPKRPG